MLEGPVTRELKTSWRPVHHAPRDEFSFKKNHTEQLKFPNEKNARKKSLRSSVRFQHQLSFPSDVRVIPTCSCTFLSFVAEKAGNFQTQTILFPSTLRNEVQNLEETWKFIYFLPRFEGWGHGPGIFQTQERLIPKHSSEMVRLLRMDRKCFTGTAHIVHSWSRSTSWRRRRGICFHVRAVFFTPVAQNDQHTCKRCLRVSTWTKCNLKTGGDNSPVEIYK